MRKPTLLIVMLGLAAASLACSLAGKAASKPTEPIVAIASPLPAPTTTQAAPLATLTPIATFTSVPQGNSQSDLGLIHDDAGGELSPAIVLEDAASIQDLETQLYVPNCVPHTDWSLYSVAAGDTLSSIARRYGTTWRALADANCLANPSLIYVGQMLRVPPTPNLPDENPNWPVIDYASPPSPSVCNVFTLNPSQTVPVYAGPDTSYGIIASLVEYAPWSQSNGNFHQIIFPNGQTGWISRYVSRLEGPCDPDFPVFTNPGNPPAAGCSAMVPTGQTVLVYSGSGIVGQLGNFAPIVQYQNGRFEIALRGWDQVGWVMESDVTLYGDCPDYHLPTPTWTPTPHPLPESLPRIGNPGLPPQDHCAVVVNQGVPVLVYPGPLTVIGPIAVLENYAFLINYLDEGYVISMSLDGREGWVSAAGTHLEGQCP